MTNVQTKNLTEKIKKTKDLKKLSELVFSISDHKQIISELINVTLSFANDLQKENKEMYDNNIKPLLLIVEDVKIRLQDEALLDEQKKDLYKTLFEAQKDISVETEKFKKSKKRDYTNYAKGASIGALTMVVLVSIYNQARKLF